MARTTLTITLDEAWDKARAWDPCGHKDRTVFWSNNGEDFKCDLEYLADDWDDDDCEPRIVEMILCVHRGMDVYDLLERYYDEDHEFGRFDDALKTEEAKREFPTLVAYFVRMSKACGGTDCTWHGPYLSVKNAIAAKQRLSARRWMLDPNGLTPYVYQIVRFEPTLDWLHGEVLSE